MDVNDEEATPNEEFSQQTIHLDIVEKFSEHLVDEILTSVHEDSRLKSRLAVPESVDSVSDDIVISEESHRAKHPVSSSSSASQPQQQLPIGQEDEPVYTDGGLFEVTIYKDAGMDYGLCITCTGSMDGCTGIIVRSSQPNFPLAPHCIGVRSCQSICDSHKKKRQKAPLHFLFLPPTITHFPPIPEDQELQEPTAADENVNTSRTQLTVEDNMTSQELGHLTFYAAPGSANHLPTDKLGQDQLPLIPDESDIETVPRTYYNSPQRSAVTNGHNKNVGLAPEKTSWTNRSDSGYSSRGSWWNDWQQSVVRERGNPIYQSLDHSDTLDRHVEHDKASVSESNGLNSETAENEMGVIVGKQPRPVYEIGDGLEQKQVYDGSLGSRSISPSYNKFSINIGGRREEKHKTIPNSWKPSNDSVTDSKSHHQVAISQTLDNEDDFSGTMVINNELNLSRSMLAKRNSVDLYKCRRQTGHNITNSIIPHADGATENTRSIAEGNNDKFPGNSYVAGTGARPKVPAAFDRRSSSDTNPDLGVNYPNRSKTKYQRDKNVDEKGVVILQRLPGEKLGMGLHIEGGEEDLTKVSGVFIEKITPGSPADGATDSLLNRLKIGDELVEINGMPLRELSQSEILTVFQELPLRVILTIYRGIAENNAMNRGETVSESESESSKAEMSDDDEEDDVMSDNSVFGRLKLPGSASRIGSRGIPDGFDKHVVLLHRETNETLGLNIIPSYGSTKGFYQVNKILASGVCHRFSEVKVGDRVFAINGIPLYGLSQVECNNTLKQASGDITLVVLRPDEDSTLSRDDSTDDNANNDEENDSYLDIKPERAEIPSPELVRWRRFSGSGGKSFQDAHRKKVRKRSTLRTQENDKNYKTGGDVHPKILEGQYNPLFGSRSVRLAFAQRQIPIDSDLYDKNNRRKRNIKVRKSVVPSNEMNGNFFLFDLDENQPARQNGESYETMHLYAKNWASISGGDNVNASNYLNHGENNVDVFSFHNGNNQYPKADGYPVPEYASDFSDKEPPLLQTISEEKERSLSPGVSGRLYTVCPLDRLSQKGDTDNCDIDSDEDKDGSAKDVGNINGGERPTVPMTEIDDLLEYLSEEERAISAKIDQRTESINKPLGIVINGKAITPVNDEKLQKQSSSDVCSVSSVSRTTSRESTVKYSRLESPNPESRPLTPSQLTNAFEAIEREFDTGTNTKPVPRRKSELERDVIASLLASSPPKYPQFDDGFAIPIVKPPPPITPAPSPTRDLIVEPPPLRTPSVSPICVTDRFSKTAEDSHQDDNISNQPISVRDLRQRFDERVGVSSRDSSPVTTTATGTSEFSYEPMVSNATDSDDSNVKLLSKTSLNDEIDNSDKNSVHSFKPVIVFPELTDNYSEKIVLRPETPPSFTRSSSPSPNRSRHHSDVQSESPSPTGTENKPITGAESPLLLLSKQKLRRTSPSTQYVYDSKNDARKPIQKNSESAAHCPEPMILNKTSRDVQSENVPNLVDNQHRKLEKDSNPALSQNRNPAMKHYLNAEYSYKPDFGISGFEEVSNIVYVDGDVQKRVDIDNEIKDRKDHNTTEKSPNRIVYSGQAPKTETDRAIVSPVKTIQLKSNVNDSVVLDSRVPAKVQETESVSRVEVDNEKLIAESEPGVVLNSRAPSRTSYTDQSPVRKSPPRFIKDDRVVYDSKPSTERGFLPVQESRGRNVADDQMSRSFDSVDSILREDGLTIDGVMEDSGIASSVASPPPMNASQTSEKVFSEDSGNEHPTAPARDRSSRPPSYSPPPVPTAALPSHPSKPISQRAPQPQTPVNVSPGISKPLNASFERKMNSVELPVIKPFNLKNPRLGLKAPPPKSTSKSGTNDRIRKNDQLVHPMVNGLTMKNTKTCIIEPIAHGERVEDGPFQIDVMRGVLGIGLKSKVTSDGYIRITDIEKNSSVERNGNIKVGDYLLCVNSVVLTGMSKSRVDQTLRLLPKGLIRMLLSVKPFDHRKNIQSTGAAASSGIENKAIVPKTSQTTMNATLENETEHGNNANEPQTAVSPTIAKKTTTTKYTALPDKTLVPNRDLLHAELLSKVKAKVTSTNKFDQNANEKRSENVVYSSSNPANFSSNLIPKKVTENLSGPPDKYPLPRNGHSVHSDAPRLSSVHKELLSRFNKQTEYEGVSATHPTISVIKLDSVPKEMRSDSDNQLPQDTSTKPTADMNDTLFVDSKVSVTNKSQPKTGPTVYQSTRPQYSCDFESLDAKVCLLNEKVTARCQPEECENTNSSKGFYESSVLTTLGTSSRQTNNDLKSDVTDSKVRTRPGKHNGAVEVFSNPMHVVDIRNAAPCSDVNSTKPNSEYPSRPIASKREERRNSDVTRKPVPLPRTKHLAMKRRLSEQYSKPVLAEFGVKPRRQSDSYSLSVANDSVITDTKYIRNRNPSGKDWLRRTSSASNVNVESLVVSSLESNREENYCLPNGITMEVALTKGVTGLGFCIEGGKGSPLGDLPIKVKRIYKGGGAGVNILKRGDELLKVNNIKIAGMNRYEAWNILKSQPQGAMKLMIYRNTS